MTDTFAPAPRPKIPVFRTAYDGYRLGLGAIFGNFAMFRFFVYGAVLSVAVLGLQIYDSFSRAGKLLVGDPAGGRSFLLDLLVAIAFGLLLAVVQTPLGIAIQRRVLLKEPPQSLYFAYALSGAGRRYVLAAFSIYILFLCASLSQTLFVFLMGHDPTDALALTAAMRADPLLLWGGLGIALLAYLFVYLLTTRLAFFFPATACERQAGSVFRARLSGSNEPLAFRMLERFRSEGVSRPVHK